MTLDDVWQARWGWWGVRPIGHELKTTARATWVRFHSLPGGERYAYDEPSHAEVLHRHNTLIDELVAESAGPDLLAITCSWSDDESPIERDEPIALAPPRAAYWTSLALANAWTHLYIGALVWEIGALDDLLRLVADETAADVIVAPADLAWLYHPYDGGGDVIAASISQRAALRERHRDWRPTGPHGL